MKNFIFGVISAAIIGVWILLVYVGIISIKTAILVPLCLVLGRRNFCWNTHNVLSAQTIGA